MAEEEEKKEESKWYSRKFIVWIVASLFFLAGIVFAFVTNDKTVVEQFIPYWGYISLLYIGGNVAQDFAFNIGQKK